MQGKRKKDNTDKYVQICNHNELNINKLQMMLNKRDDVKVSIFLPKIGAPGFSSDTSSRHQVSIIFTKPTQSHVSYHTRYQLFFNQMIFFIEILNACFECESYSIYRYIHYTDTSKN